MDDDCMLLDVICNCDECRDARVKGSSADEASQKPDVAVAAAEPRKPLVVPNAGRGGQRVQQAPRRRLSKKSPASEGPDAAQPSGHAQARGPRGVLRKPAAQKRGLIPRMKAIAASSRVDPAVDHEPIHLPVRVTRRQGKDGQYISGYLMHGKRPANVFCFRVVQRSQHRSCRS